MTFFRKLVANVEGATAIEYGLIASLIAVSSLTALQLLGSEITGSFEKTANAMESANN